MDCQYTTIKETAATLGVSRECATELVHREIPHLQVGRAIRIRRDVWEAWQRDRERMDTPKNAMRWWKSAREAATK